MNNVYFFHKSHFLTAWSHFSTKKWWLWKEIFEISCLIFWKIDATLPVRWGSPQTPWVVFALAKRVFRAFFNFKHYLTYLISNLFIFAERNYYTLSSCFLRNARQQQKELFQSTFSTKQHLKSPRKQQHVSK